MLVIGHRGAKGLDHENTLASIQAGVDAGSLIIEFDVRLTKDGVPVVIHDRTLARTHSLPIKIDAVDHKDLQKLTADKTPIPSLKQVLDEYWGVVFLNIEIKGRRVGTRVTEFIKDNYIKNPQDWENCFISSFHIRELRRIRKVSDDAKIGLIHNRNPFAFIACTRQLNLSAVGFHRLYANPLAIEIAKKTNLFTYAYTVNRPKGALLLASSNIDAVVTDYPDRIHLALEKNNLLS